MPPDDVASYLQLLSLAVHEFRTPASVVAGYLRMLQRDADQPLSERQRRMVDEAEKSIQHLSTLVGELSEIQKLDAERVDMGRQQFDLFTVVGEVAAGMHEAADRGVRLEARGSIRGVTMEGDLTLVQRAISAIFRGILREMPSDTLVVCERKIERTDGKTAAVLVVAAEPGVQAAYSAPAGPFDEMRGGLGMALPFARRIIERHGGRISAPADQQRRGAAIVRLPVAEPAR